jgi:LPXTG-site transpeptidase (sortase) family protein
MKKFLKPAALVTLVGILLLVSGGALLIALYRSRVSDLTITPPAHASAASSASRSDLPTYLGGQPSRILIPSLHIDLPIVPGYYNVKTRTWTLTTNSVQYAVMTPEANNQGGNTFLYGHYRSNVFASLHTIQANAEAIVETSNHHTFYYQLSGVRVVSHGDSDSVFRYTGAPILTVQTCTGIFFQNRQLFTFNLTKAV